MLVNIYCADGATSESILVDPLLSVGGALKLMAEKSCVDCHVKWGLVERLPELFIDRCLEDDEKLLRVISSWKPQTPNRLIFAQRPEKYDLFRRPERYLLDPYDKMSTENVMQTPWSGTSRQSLVQRCIDSVSQASTTLLEGPLWLKTDGKKWKKFHFILRDYNLFQTTKSKKGSVHDVHFVASLATVKVYNGIGWKKRYKAPTDFCFALKPPEVQEKKAHIRYLCAENEFVKWGWYSMLRLTLGPPQQLVDNYNAQLGVPKTEVSNNGLSRSASITSNGDCSMSSGCMSEADEENAFDVEYPDGGTIRRKPTAPGGLQPLPAIIGDTLPLPPPPQSPGDLTPTDNGHTLPLPPPPLPLVEESHVQQAIVQTAVREEIYPCGIMRTRYPTEVNSATEEVSQNEGGGASCPEGVSQLSLLQQLPSQPPPNLHNLMMHDTTAGVNGTNTSSSAPSSKSGEKRKITFSEYVHNLEESVFERLKGSSEEPEEAETYKQQDVSNWVLDSLRHCSNGSSPPSSSGSSSNGGCGNCKPKIYNGRSVPNCFSPEEIQQRLQAPPAKFPPPPPPMRSDGTYLTH